MHRLRRRHRGGHQPRGQRPRRAPAAGQPHRHLRRQRDLHRGRHPDRQERGRGRPLRGVRLARADRRLAQRRRRPGRLPRGRRGAVRGAAWPPRRRPAGPRSSRCAPSSAGPRRTSRTPARSTARRSAPTRSPATKKILGFDPEQTFEVDDEVLGHAREVIEPRPGAARRSGPAAFDAWAKANPERTALLRPAGQPRTPRRLDRRAAGLPRRRQGRRHPRRLRQGAGRARAGAARAVGRLGRPGREQQHHDEGRAVVHPGRVRHQGRSPATSTAARCTSASASTAWARSSTASRCTAAPARTAARSWSSATTCARRCGWPR